MADNRSAAKKSVKTRADQADVAQKRPRSRGKSVAYPSECYIPQADWAVSSQSPRIPQIIYVVGGWALAALAFFGDFGGHQNGVVAQSFGQSFKRDLCQEVVQPNAVLSREDLAQMLTIPERSAKSALREIIAEPYCQLPGLAVRADVTAMREAYPLAFDPQTWLVLLYEGKEYAGYAFYWEE